VPVTTFIVDGRPSPKGSTRSFVARDGRVVTKSACRTLHAWERDVGLAARAARAPLAPAGQPVCVSVLFDLKRPRSAPDRPCPTVVPDLDKLVRGILDGLTGICYVDDSQVVEIYARKRFGVASSATITVRQEG
jgi:crossover junction endodeoxyribonuclease RusA